MGESRDELLRQISELREANAALVDGHANMTVAYLALRFSKLEERLDRLEKEWLPKRMKEVNLRIDAFAEACKKLDGRIKELET